MIGRNSQVRLHSGDEVGTVRYLTAPQTRVQGEVRLEDGAVVDWPRTGSGWHCLRDLVELRILADLRSPDG